MHYEKECWGTVKTIRILLSILVVFIHANNLSTYSIKSGYVFWIENYIGNGICKMAVPFFFLLSGLCTYFSLDRNSSVKENGPEIRKKMTSRIYSLLIPYIIWILITWGGTVLPKVLPVISSHVGGSGEIVPSLKSFLITLFTANGTHLWFLNDLIILSFFMPVIFEIMRHKPIAVVICIVLFAANCFYSRADTDWIRVLLDYLTGVLIALHGKEVLAKSLASPRSGWKITVFSVLFLILSGVEAFILINNTGRPFENIVLFFMMICFWIIFCNVTWNGKDYSFWLYLSHGLFLVYVKTAAYLILPKNEIVALLSFFVIPVAVIFLLLGIATLLDRKWPKLFSVLTGKRNGSEKRSEGKMVETADAK